MLISQVSGVEDYSDDDPIVNMLFEPPMPGWGEIGGKEWWRTHWTKRKACSGCQMHCSHFYVVRDGPFPGTMGEGPDAETQGWLTVLVGNSSKEIAAFGNSLLNKLGMDSIEMGAIVRGVMKCYERGVLTDDGDLSYLLTRPAHKVWKTYEVTVNGPVSEDDPRLETLRGGIDLDGRATLPAKARRLPGPGDRRLVPHRRSGDRRRCGRHLLVGVSAPAGFVGRHGRGNCWALCACFCHARDALRGGNKAGVKRTLAYCDDA